MRLRWWAAAGTALVAGVAGGGLFVEQLLRPHAARYYVVTPTDVEVTRPVSGVLEPRAVWSLGFGTVVASESAQPVPAPFQAVALGPVKTIAVTVGEQVRKGQLLAAADTSDLDACLAQVTAGERQAQALLASDQQTAAQAAPVTATAAAPHPSVVAGLPDVLAAQGRLGADLDRVQRFDSEIQQLEQERAAARILAPGEGFVTAVDAFVGARLAWGTPIVTVRSQELQVRLTMDWGTASNVTSGMPARITVSGQTQELATLLTTLPPQSSSAAPTGPSSGFSVLLPWASPPPQVWPGEPVDAELVMNRQLQVTAVPNTALHHDHHGRTTITTLSCRDTARQHCSAHTRTVTPGLAGNQLTAIPGLAVGTLVADG